MTEPFPTYEPSYAFVADWNDSPPIAPRTPRDQRRALTIGSDLDSGRSRQVHGDPRKVATAHQAGAAR
jgi:hypothetical protein